MNKFLFIFFVFYSSFCFAQNNNPQPPFSNLYRRPNIHPYTFINPNNNAMDYQQMFYLQDKTENLTITNENLYQNRTKKQYNRNHTPPIQNNQNIRPTGHKSYFMTLP